MNSRSTSQTQIPSNITMASVPALALLSASELVAIIRRGASK